MRLMVNCGDCSDPVEKAPHAAQFPIRGSRLVPTNTRSGPTESIMKCMTPIKSERNSDAYRLLYRRLGD